MLYQNEFFYLITYWYFLPLVITFLYIANVDDGRKYNEYKDIMLYLCFIPCFNILTSTFVVLRMLFIMKRKMF